MQAGTKLFETTQFKYPSNHLRITSEVTLPSNGGYPTLPYPANKTVTSNRATLTLLAWWLNAQNFSLYTGLSPNFRIVEKINLMHQRSMGINAVVKHDRVLYSNNSQKFSKLRFGIPNEESKFWQCVKVVQQVSNVKISRSEFNGTTIGIILDPIADPWGWFEISKWGNLCYIAFESIEFTRNCQAWWLESIGTMTTIISDPIAGPWGWF